MNEDAEETGTDTEEIRLRRTGWYVGALCALAVAAVVVWAGVFGLPFGREAVFACAILAGSCVVFGLFPVRLGGDRAELEPLDVAMLTAVVLVGPLWALVAAAPAMGYRDRLRTLFTAATDAITLCGAGTAFYLVCGLEPLLSGGASATTASGFGPTAGRLAAGIVAAGLAYHLLDDLAGVGVLRVKHDVPMMKTVREVMIPAAPADAAGLVAVFASAWALLRFGPVAPLALFSGAAGVAAIYHLVAKHRAKIEEARTDAEERRRAAEVALASPVAFASGLVEQLGRRDGRSALLAAASAVYASDLAAELRLGDEKASKLGLAALLQDVGLASVPDEILLTPEEKLNSLGRARLREHPEDSERVIATAAGLEEVARWVRWHHERADGTGYPDRLRGEWLPLEAKILSCASVYASLVLDGPHRPGLAPEEARKRLVEEIGKALDGAVVRALLRVLDSEDEAYAVAADRRFRFSGADSRGVPLPSRRVPAPGFAPADEGLASS